MGPLKMMQPFGGKTVRRPTIQRWTPWIWFVFSYLCASSALTGAVPATRPVQRLRRVVIVSVDGLRPDLLLRAATPNMHNLMGQGSYTLWARTVDEVYTVPSHVSMLTGVSPARHGITWDNYIEDAYPKVPTLFELAKRAGYSTALAVGKGKLIVLTKPGTLDWKYVADEEREDDLAVARHAAELVRNHRPDVLFVHLGHADMVGHASGWGSSTHIKSIDDADRALGMILRALTQTKLVDSTLIILTADHGGAGLQHPPENATSQFIPWIAVGPSVRKNFDLTSITGLAVNTMDTFATACTLLGIETGQINGKPVLQILEPATENRPDRRSP